MCSTKSFENTVENTQKIGLLVGYISFSMFQQRAFPNKCFIQNMKKLLLLMVCGLPLTIFSQVGIGTTNPSGSSVLDIESITGGVLIPRMTEAQRNAILSPSESLLIYQTDSGVGFYYFNGLGWVPFAASSGEFLSVSGVVQNTTDLINDDFVFGSPQLNDTNTLLGLHDARFFFDKSKGAFRAGLVEGGQWNNGAVGDYSTAFGFNTIASGAASLAFGEETLASGNASVAAGQESFASGDAALAFGFQVQASGDSSIALGEGSIASGNISVAIGENAEASSGTSIAIGSGSIASSGNAIALGQDAQAISGSSIALGRDAIASSASSMAIGRDALANGSHAIAIGRDAIASGAQAIGIGSFSDASGSQSITLGFTNAATSTFAMAMGTFTTASGTNATTLGLETTAPSFAETTVGMYSTDYTPTSNILFVDSDRVFSVGNGQSTTLRSNAMTILKNGNIGIGIDVPTDAKLVIEGFQNSSLASNYGFLDSSGTTGQTSGAGNYSIKASDMIAGAGFHAYSDARIKHIIGPSNPEKDLAILSKIEITDYLLKDSLRLGKTPFKKVIAQQLKQVYPQAVTDNLIQIIPDIYVFSEIHHGLIPIVPTNLLPGDTVELIFSDHQELVEVLEIRDDGIKVLCSGEGNVFVFGKKVTDFHSVDYEALTALNISATQAILKHLEALELLLKELQARLEVIEKEFNVVSSFSKSSINQPAE